MLSPHERPSPPALPSRWLPTAPGNRRGLDHTHAKQDLHADTAVPNRSDMYSSEEGKGTKNREMGAGEPLTAIEREGGGAQPLISSFLLSIRSSFDLSVCQDFPGFWE